MMAAHTAKNSPIEMSPMVKGESVLEWLSPAGVPVDLSKGQTFTLIVRYLILFYVLDCLVDQLKK